MKSLWLPIIAVAAFAQTPLPTGSVSGTVTDAVTHIPIKKVAVSIMGMGGPNQGPAATATDAGGGFTLTNLQAGQYRLVFQHQSYPQARFGNFAKSVDVKAGEAAGPINVELMPGAAVSGHIVDEDGDPLANCGVQIHPAKNPEQGAPMVGNSSSNQDGEWRAFGIPPGKYTASAHCGRAVFQARPLSAGPDPPPSRAYPIQYYPLSAESKGAQVIELTGGNEKSGVDFLMSPVPVTQVRAVFAPGGADWHGDQLAMQLLRSGERMMNSAIGGAPNLDKGTFDFRQVFPGSYTLVAFSQGPEENRIGAWQRVDVSDKPVDLVVELKHALDLTGKVEIESSGNNTNKITPVAIFIQLLPQSQMGLPPAQTQVSEDGTFTLKGVLPAIWRLHVNGPSVFVKAAWLGSTDVTNAPLDVSGGAAGALRIIVSTNTATIRGSAPAGQMVRAERLDEDLPFRGGLMASVDQNGQYMFVGLAPGKYRLMLTDSGAVSQEGEGQEVTVREGETVMVDLKAP